MISDRKQYIGIKNNIVFELFQFLFMLEWFLACISHFSAHIPTSFSVFMPNICCLDKLDNKHYAYRLIMMWEYGQKNEKYWPGSIPAHIRIGKVLNVVIFDTNNCLLCNIYFVINWILFIISKNGLLYYAYFYVFPFKLQFSLLYTAIRNQKWYHSIWTPI